MIIAVDFDGILCRNDFPGIGSPDYAFISFVRQLMDQGHEVILWTSRVDAPEDEAVKWCEDRGLHFTAVNDNAPSNKAKYAKEYPSGTRKVYADIYIDDHNPEFKFREARFGRGDAVDHTIATVRSMIKWKTKEN